MKELKELSANYATEKTNEMMSQIVAQAFADGYRMGYKDREDEIPVDLRDGNTEYVDLGLPSQTLWANNYEQRDGDVLYLPYEKALNYMIPSEKQWKELVDNCRWVGDYSSSGLSFYGITCIGPNGNSIRFGTAGFVKNEQVTGRPLYGGGSAYFWLNEITDGNEKKALKVSGGEGRIPDKEIVDMFSGYKLPVRLVRAK